MCMYYEIKRVISYRRLYINPVIYRTADIHNYRFILEYDVFLLTNLIVELKKN